MEADLWHHYHGLDLRDLWRPGGGRSRLTWRLLGNLVRHLPPESATMTALRNDQPADAKGGGDPSKGRWSQAEVLLAGLLDEFRYLRHDYTSTHLAKGAKKPTAPEPIPRPGVTSSGGKRQKGLTAEQYDVLYRHINGLQQDGVTFKAIGKGKAR